MILIYSKNEIKGVGGVYCDPAYFDGEIDTRATMVITKDKAIQEAYYKVGIDVKGFPRSSGTTNNQSVEKVVNTPKVDHTVKPA